MALIDDDKPLAPISSIAELLNVKQRTLKMYEEKGLLPKRQNEKKLYSLSDIKKIAFVHYLASSKRINANGIKFINELMEQYIDPKDAVELLKSAEDSIEKSPNSDFENENF